MQQLARQFSVRPSRSRTEYLIYRNKHHEEQPGASLPSASPPELGPRALEDLISTSLSGAGFRPDQDYSQLPTSGAPAPRMTPESMPE